MNMYKVYVTVQVCSHVGLQAEKLLIWKLQCVIKQVLLVLVYCGGSILKWLKMYIHFPCYIHTNFIWMASDTGDHSGCK